MSNLINFDLGGMNECIIYLVSIKRLNDSNYNALIDFRTKIDLDLFKKFINLRKSNNTISPDCSYIEIRGLKSNKRLFTGCYYKLNLELLKDQPYEYSEDSLIIALTFFINNLPYPLNEESEIFQKHLPLDTMELSLKIGVSPDFNFPEIKRELTQIRVRNVGQANWNELLEGNTIKVVYDMGFPIFAKKTDIDSYCTKIKPILEKDKPLLVISHWDLDHIHCLKSFTSDDIKKCFSSLICVDKTKSLASTSIYKKLEIALERKNVIRLPVPERTKKKTMHLYNGYKCKNISFYQGEDSRNINYAGLCMFVKGQVSSVVFTGDVKLSQAKNIYDQEKTKGLRCLNHILIAPHHGGDVNKASRIYALPCNEAIISVGTPNPYNHPDKNMLGYLSEITNHHVKRTDWIKCDIIENI